MVLGATGHIGQAVVRHALERGWEVTALTRRVNPRALRGLALNVVRIDSELRSLAEVASGHDLLVDAAAPYPVAPGIQGGAHWRTEVDGAIRRMEVVIEAARSNQMRLAYVSSCTTLHRTMSPPDAAAAVWRRSVTPYFEAKAGMERAVVAAARNGLPAVIVNPGTFLGPWDFRETKNSFVARVLERGFPMVLNQGMCVIDVRDVADAIDRALFHEVYGLPIPLSGHNLALLDLVMFTSQLAGLTPTVPFPLQPGAVSASTYWTQWAYMAFGVVPPETLNFIHLIADVLPMERSPEQIALGVEIRPLEDTLRDSIAFHRELV
jgi:dihydroflavonol-4-reductase